MFGRVIQLNSTEPGNTGATYLHPLQLWLGVALHANVEPKRFSGGHRTIGERLDEHGAV